MTKKTLKTIKEDKKGKNLKTIDTKNLSIEENKKLIKKIKAWELPWYNVVKPKNKDEYIRANPNKTKKDNLDPKIKISKKKK